MSKKCPTPHQEPYRPQAVVPMQHVRLGPFAESCRVDVTEDIWSQFYKQEAQQRKSEVGI